MKRTIAQLAAVSAVSAQWWTYNDFEYTNEPISITVNSHITYQTMIGGSCSGAFGIACQQFGSVGLSTENQESVTQTLFDENIVSARLWAFAQFFRFACPGTVRVDAQSCAPDEVFATACVNTYETVAIPVINAAHFPSQVSIGLLGMNVTTASMYKTDNTHNVTLVGQFSLNGTVLQDITSPRAYFLE